MNAGRWKFPVAAAAVAVLVAVVMMPSDTSESRRRLLAPAIVAVQDSIAIVQAEADSLRRLFQVRSAELRAASFGAAPNGIRFVRDAGVPAATAERFEQFALREASELVREMKHPVVVVLQRDSLTPIQYRKSVVAPREAGHPCVVIVRIGNRRVADLRPHAEDQLLAACGLYARFGAPGDGMRQWLLGGGLSQVAAHSAAPRVTPSGRFSAQSSELMRAPTAGACLAGRLDACHDLFEGRYFYFDQSTSSFRERTRPQGADRGVALQQITSFYMSEGTLATIRRDLGDERFAALWMSASGPAEAYAALEGQPLGALVRDQLRSTIKYDFEPGPMRRWMPLLALVLTALVVGTAIGFSSRRYA